MFSGQNISSLVYSNFIRYERLKDLTLTQFANSNADKVNIYIDISSLFKTIFQYDDIIQDRTLICSMILNLAAHYRAYYKSRHGVHAYIYLVYARSKLVLTQQEYYIPQWSSLPEFGKDSSRVNNIKVNMELLKLIAPYFPDVYFIDSPASSAVEIKNLITKNTGYPNIIISKDTMCWQIPALYLSTCIFRPRRTKSEDTSYVVNHSNLISMYISSYNRGTIAQESIIPSELFALYLALSSYKDRGLYAYYSYKDAIKKIHQLINTQRIYPGLNSDVSMVKVLTELNIENSSMITKKCGDIDDGYNRHMFNLVDRYHLIELSRLTQIYQMQFPQSHDESWKFSKEDPDSVRELNDKYFVKNPIDIIRLMDV